MKQYYFLFLLIGALCSCKSTGKSFKAPNPTRTQVLVAKTGCEDGPMNPLPSGTLPGKCYGKFILNGQCWLGEILCSSQTTPPLIFYIQQNLISIGYLISQDEIDQRKYGKTTKAAFNQFRLENDLAIGSLDWATVNILDDKVRELSISSEVATKE